MHTYERRIDCARSLLLLGLGIGLGLGLAGMLPAANAADGPRFGRPATRAEVAAVDIDIGPTGVGLPAGSGSAGAGAALFAARCAACHGSTGVEGPYARLVGGRGSLASAAPLKTIGSYWQYAPTVYDYINRAMPFAEPGSLQPDEVYSLVAFLLARNGVIGKAEVMDRDSLPKVLMPNRNGFVVEPAFRKVQR